MSLQVHKNLQEEREKIRFNINELSECIFGSRHDLETFLRMQDYMDKEPVQKFNPDFNNLSRQEKMSEYIKKFHNFHAKFDFNKEDSLVNQFAFYNDPLISSLHQVMFIPCLKILTTAKQYEKWYYFYLKNSLKKRFLRVPLAESYKMVGCYAQTEMGHGSDVQNLETLAVFDPNTDEFVLQSPTITSTKMWPGDLGIYGNYAMVFAQLLIHGTNHGVQAFLVPIRDLETHEPLPGVEVGDIGPKLGFSTKDNGFLRLNNVRIPRENMLMKYAKVTKAGEFKIVGDEKALYGIMMSVRLIIAGFSPRFLAHGLTVALRYSIVRTQFKGDNKQEIKILDYQLQQEKLFPIVANYFSMVFTSMRLRKLVADNFKRIQENDFSLLNETHIVLSGTKALFTYQILFGMEKCRLACGGHGFSQYSSLPALQQEVAANCTLEGENTVMFLQVARFLLKMYNKASKGQKLHPLVDYMSNCASFLDDRCEATSLQQFRSLEVLRKLLMNNALYWVHSTGMSVMENLGKGLSMKEIWDKKIGLSLVDAARAHTQYYVFNCFSEGVRNIRDEHLRETLMRVCELYGVQVILENPLGVIESGFLNNEQIKLLNELRETLFKEIRPDAIGLADATRFSDNTLRSALGRYDGRVYETMYEWATKNNSFQDAPGMEYILKMKHVQPKL